MRIILFLVVCHLPVTNYGQAVEHEIDLQKITDEIFTIPDDAADYEDLYENLVQIFSSPLDLNTATREELEALHVLTDIQIANLLSYRTEHGKFIDVHELQIIPDFDLSLIERLLPLVHVVDPLTTVNRSVVQRMISPGHSYVITRYERTLEKMQGFNSTSTNSRAYLGSPDKVYFRYGNSLPGDYSLGLIGEKDAGEQFGFNPKQRQWGFDHVSYHFQLKNKGPMKNLIIGDFQSQFAQGIILGGAFGFGKGGESVSTARKTNVGFRPFTSIQENAYQRGLATTILLGPSLYLSASYSRVRRDASMTGEDIATVSSFQMSGYHRSERELANRKKVVEQNAAVVLRVNKGRVDAGLIANIFYFDTPVRRTPTVYNQFNFNGNRNVNTGFFLNYTLQNVSFFSETARSLKGGWATIMGSLVNVHTNLELVMLYRRYDPDYHALLSNAFSENSLAQNERGFYWGWKYRWDRRYSVNGYADLFHFPWLGFRRYRPAHGYEWLLRTNYTPSRKIALFVQFREECKPSNSEDASILYLINNRLRHYASFLCDYGVVNGLRWKARVQYNATHVGSTTTEGWAFVQDITVTMGRVRLTGRHALFDTDQYDNRQYVYESDAWGAYSFPAYSGTGVRNYVLFEYKVNKKLTLWLRYARTSRTDVAEIGSGQDLIAGNTRNDVKFQARLKF